MREISIETISGKTVYTFKDHATALIPWAEQRRKLKAAPNLITLDFHTDTMYAFRSYLCRQKFDYPGVSLQETTEQLCGKIDYRYAGSVAEAVNNLKNEEQIDTAVKAGIFDYAFVISYYGRGTTGFGNKKSKVYGFLGESQTDKTITFSFTELEETFEDLLPAPPENKIFIIDKNAGFEYPNVDISDDDKRRHCDLAIESEYLDAKLEVADRMCRSYGQTSIGERKYILDIDLDYFTTEKSIAPKDARTFYKLIRNAEAITVALEPTYVLAERLSGETITSEFLLSRLQQHLRSALSGRESGFSR